MHDIASQEIADTWDQVEALGAAECHSLSLAAEDATLASPSPQGALSTRNQLRPLEEAVLEVDCAKNKCGSQVQEEHLMSALTSPRRALGFHNSPVRSPHTICKPYPGPSQDAPEGQGSNIIRKPLVRAPGNDVTIHRRLSTPCLQYDDQDGTALVPFDLGQDRRAYVFYNGTRFDLVVPEDALPGSRLAIALRGGPAETPVRRLPQLPSLWASTSMSVSPVPKKSDISEVAGNSQFMVQSQNERITGLEAELYKEREESKKWAAEVDKLLQQLQVVRLERDMSKTQEELWRGQHVLERKMEGHEQRIKEQLQEQAQDLQKQLEAQNAEFLKLKQAIDKASDSVTAGLAPKSSSPECYSYCEDDIHDNDDCSHSATSATGVQAIATSGKSVQTTPSLCKSSAVMRPLDSACTSVPSATSMFDMRSTLPAQSSRRPGSLSLARQARLTIKPSSLGLPQMAQPISSTCHSQSRPFDTSVPFVAGNSMRCSGPVIGNNVSALSTGHQMPQQRRAPSPLERPYARLYPVTSAASTVGLTPRAVLSPRCIVGQAPANTGVVMTH